MAALLLTLVATNVQAEDQRPFCADRPGKGSPPCIVDTGHAMIEFGMVDYARSNDGAVRSENTGIGNLVLRYGLANTIEASVGWTPFTIANSRSGGLSRTEHATGDVTLGAKLSLFDASGEGVSIAVSPLLAIPTHGGGVAMGLLLPISLPLPGGIGLAVTPEIDRAPDSGGPGHHVAASVALGVEIPAGPLALGAELWAGSDYDPAGHNHQASLDFSAAWVPESRPNLQFDVGVNLGLNAASDDVEVYIGVARRF